MLKEKLRTLLLNKKLKGSETGIIPLCDIKSAAVYISETSVDCAKAINAINSFFASKRIPVIVYSFVLGPAYLSESSHKATFIHKNNFGFVGKVKRRFLRSKINLNSDLVINLTNDLFAADYCVAATKAKFRVGRRQLSSQMYDLVCTEPEGKNFNEVQIFKYITDILVIIK